jgi:hypothetical protein
MKEWNPNAKILISGKDGCTMSFNTVYYYCEVDEHNVMKKVVPAFDYDN